MTTPERLRARQRKEGIVLILLAIFTVAQAIYFNIEGRGQRDCIETKFSLLSESLTARGSLTAREAENTRKAIGAAAESIRTGNEAVLSQALADYEAEAEEIAKTRKNNPLPPYPAGTCGVE